MGWTLRSFDDHARLAGELAEAVSRALAAAVAERGAATLMVSGGSTPAPFFQALSRADLPWEKINIGLVDERWVDEDHADANAGLVKKHLLQGPAAAANWFPLKTAAPSPEEAAGEAGERVRSHLPLDVVVLGMGADGHTASFFPDAKDLSGALAPEEGALCAAVRAPSAGHPRMTLTLPAILGAGRVFLHVTGAEKRGILEQETAGGKARENSLPVSLVLHQDRVPVEIYAGA